jgi:hypothetical protein
MRHPQKRRQARDGQCTQNFGHATTSSTKRPRRYKHEVFVNHNHSKEEEIYTLTVKEIVEA